MYYHIKSDHLLRGGLLLSMYMLMYLFFTSAAIAQQHYRLDEAPFYKTVKKHQVSPDAHFVHLPVMIDEKVRTEFFYQDREEVLLPVTEVIDSYLDSLAWTTSVKNPMPEKGSPYVFVGSSEAETAPPGAEMMREDFDTFPPMMAYVEKPSKEWRAQLVESMSAQQADYAILIWIGFNKYPKSRKGVFKKKVILGTEYEPEIRFLSAEDKPVEVLQLCAVLIDSKGVVLRTGSEAFLYEDAPFWAQVVGINRSIDDRSIEQSIAGVRRDDLPGNPLAWKVAVNNLMDHIVQRQRAS